MCNSSFMSRSQSMTALTHSARSLGPTPPRKMNLQIPEGIIDCHIVLQVIAELRFPLIRVGVQGLLVAEIGQGQPVAEEIGKGLQVAAAPIRRGIIHGHAGEGPRVMVSDLQSLGVDGKLMSPRPYLLRGGSDAIGEEIPQALPVGDEVDRLDDRPMISPVQIGVMGTHAGQDPLFLCLDGEGDNRRGGDGVQAVAVAKLIGSAECFPGYH